jgi:hypothetical protein
MSDRLLSTHGGELDQVIRAAVDGGKQTDGFAVRRLINCRSFRRTKMTARCLEAVTAHAIRCTQNRPFMKRIAIRLTLMRSCNFVSYDWQDFSQLRRKISVAERFRQAGEVGRNAVDFRISRDDQYW